MQQLCKGGAGCRVHTPFHTRGEDVPDIIRRVLAKDRAQTFGPSVAICVEEVVLRVLGLLTMAEKVDGRTVELGGRDGDQEGQQGEDAREEHCTKGISVRSVVEIISYLD